MPPAVYTQSIIALIWDFDKTLTHGYMQDPLFKKYGVGARKFWGEVNSLRDYYDNNGGYRVSPDTVYLNHILAYVRNGIFDGLTANILRELGSEIELAPGLPDFFDKIADVVKEDRYQKNDVKVEHYIVSTGLRAMIEGCPVARYVNGIWACDLLPQGPSVQDGDGSSQDYLPESEGVPDVLREIGYAIDNTSKTRAIFEINKGVNVNEKIDVNSKIPDDQRRVPFKNMIYIADGPSDIPSFSVVNSKGGKTLGVYAPGDENYTNAYKLEQDGRVNSITQADYQQGSPAYMWLRQAVCEIADEIVSSRERVLGGYSRNPSHVV